MKRLCIAAFAVLLCVYSYAQFESIEIHDSDLKSLNPENPLRKLLLNL